MIYGRDNKGRILSKHGFCYHPLYKTWLHMIYRCENPNNPYYYRYGGRGITVCERWHDIALFIEDIMNIIGPKPTPNHSIDRIDNNAGYFPDNIRWATPREQAQNRRMPRTNTSGYMNVNWDNSKRRWQARVTVNGKRMRLGRFKTKEDALLALKGYRTS